MNEMKINILFVENDKDYAHLIFQSFEPFQQRMRVTFASNLHEARISVLGSIPDLIITNYVLPDGKGSELLSTNMEEPPYFILIMGDYREKDIADKSIKAGAFDFIVKTEEAIKNMPNICERILREWRLVSKSKKLENIRKLFHAVEQSSSTVLITDTRGNIEYANSKFTQLTGYSLEEAIGKNSRMLQSGKTSPEVYEKLWKAILSGNEWHGEFCNKKKNNELYWENASISPVKDNNGVIINFIAVKEDITVRKCYEAQIKELNRLNKELLGFGKLEEKLKRITDNIVKLFNADFARIWLTKSGDRCDSGCIHADSKDQEHICTQRNACLHLTSSSGRYTHIDGRMHSRVPFSCYKIGRIAAGEIPKYLSNDIINDEFIHGKEWARNLDLTSFAGYQLISATNKTVGVMAVFSKNFISSDTDYLLESLADTTAHVIQSAKTEMALLHSEKLKSLGEIAAGVSHEINNILATTMGSAEVLLEGYDDERELKNGLNSIVDASSDGAEIVKMMLTFANAEVVTYKHCFFDLKNLIKQAIAFTMPRWKNMAQSEGINYRLDTEGVIQVPKIYCNPIELREVLVNLINNAMDAMPGGGHITLSTKIDKDYILLSVSDTGVGMPEDVKQRIFDPFYTTRRPHGTGLGLSVSYSIIKKHGGEITVESEAGKGTTFMLSIPVSKGAVQKTMPPVLGLKPKVKKRRKKDLVSWC